MVLELNKVYENNNFNGNPLIRIIYFSLLEKNTKKKFYSCALNVSYSFFKYFIDLTGK